MIVGYARVSSVDQNERRQLDALEKSAAEKVYIDKQSGKDFNRPAYQQMIESLEENDLLIVPSIDRLGRNYAEIQEQWYLITKKIKADIMVLDMPLLDTRKEKSLIGTFVADMVLQVLSFVAEQERRNIKSRQAQGIAAAKARGVRFGRPPKVKLSLLFHAVVMDWTRKKISGTEAARRCQMPLSTFRYFAIPLREKLLNAMEE